MENKYCKNCAKFHQHYSLDDKKLFQVFCRHCTAAHRTRKRQPDTPACDHFVPAPPSETPFVTKEYLSKALLEYMLQLELLPQIPDTPEQKV